MSNERGSASIDFIAAFLTPVGIFFLGCAFALAITELPQHFHSSNLYYIVASGGVILALFTYLINRRRDQEQQRKERERIHQYNHEKLVQRQNEIYRAIDDKYFAYLRYCLENVELDVYDIPNSKIPYFPTKVVDKKKELIAYTMLISMMEIAYIEYISAPKEIKENQEGAWHKYIEQFAGRENFKWAYKIWKGNESFSFDNRFVAHMEKIMKEGEGSV